MNNHLPTASGWYPDPHTGGTRYWDGSRWTGDGRPPRRSFAPDARYDDLVRIIPGVGILFGIGFFGLGFGDGLTVFGVMWIAACAIATVYVLRGQGLTTKAVQERLAAERAAADKAARRDSRSRSRGGPLIGINVQAPDVTGAAQVNAIANPETARAMQNLSNLRFNRVLSDDEFAAAKGKLLGSDGAPPNAIAHLEKLASLHKAGVLSDNEFAAAKAKALDI